MNSKMMNGVGIWDIVTYVQKRAMLQTRSIDKMLFRFSFSKPYVHTFPTYSAAFLSHLYFLCFP